MIAAFSRAVGRLAKKQIASIFLVSLLSLATVVGLDRGGYLPRDQVADALIGFHAKRQSETISGQRFTFIDIDQATYHAWGEPAVTPRAKLLDLLQALTAIDGPGPRMIVVDIDTAYRSGSFLATRPAFADDNETVPTDQRLQDWLANYKGAPPLFLVRSLDTQEKIDPADHRPPLPRAQSSGLDRTASSGLNPDRSPARGVHWATSRFRQGPDGVVRHGWLWRTVCLEGEPAILPSFQLLALLAISRVPEGAMAETEAILGKQVPEDCSGRVPAPVADQALMSIATDGGRRIELDLDAKAASQRIIYGIAFEQSPNTSEAASKHIDAGQPGFMRVSAGLLFNDQGALRLDHIDPLAFAGRTVIIGASHEDARDLHETPIGLLPGAVIIINAILSLEAHGTLKAPHWAIRMLHAIPVFCVLLLLYHYLAPAIVAPVASLCMLAATAWSSVYWLERGIWLDVAVAAAAFVLFKTLIERVPYWLDWSEGARKLLHPRYHRHGQNS